MQLHKPKEESVRNGQDEWSEKKRRMLNREWKRRWGQFKKAGLAPSPLSAVRKSKLFTY